MSGGERLNPYPLHQQLADVLGNHMQEHGASAEHLAVEVDVRDLEDWQEHARVNYDRGWALREREAALVAALRALVDTDPIVRYSGALHGCHYCEAEHWRHEGVAHAEGCAWVAARDLLGEG